ncbi:ABC transporter substrate-binding protein [Phytoactinopolyspora mesophila]|uniref:Solute-binding protein family 5 domain-containing protein n=1 Tax=Phytoactinopolyspora mesophila TaxID=2650750 RepID=A0A7K3M049_9ACTN|nr:ABC transporter substrate-binding protein [Phytoactinopolyspora mesophila]NDL56666.1 hypothetical protein [Phytoactinopolyspora mesophila]
MKLQSHVPLAALGLSLALIVAACGTDDDDPDVAPSRTTLEVATVIEPPDIFPYSGHGAKAQVFDAMLHPIIRTDAEGELYSDVLESWDVSGDALTVTFSLRPDIEWSDGTPMSSADIVMSLTQHLDPEISELTLAVDGVAGESEFLNGDADTVSGLSAPDDLTVVVELEQPDPTWLPRLTMFTGILILPDHVLGDVPHDELENHEYFNSYPVTNGPYTFVEWAPGQHVEFERNENWSLGEPGFERLFIKVIDADVASAQLETREVQFVSLISPGDVDRIGSLDGIEIQTTPGDSPNKWGLMHHGPLLDNRVRQAMVYAIDREGICQLVLDGHCTVPVANNSQIGPDWAIPTTGVTEYTYDPDRARGLLAEAGWDPETELVFLDYLGTEAEALAVAQDNMADVGINWTIENVDVSTLNERTEEAPESFHGFMAGGGTWTVDPSIARTFYSCDEKYPPGANRGHYCNEELELLLTAGHEEADPNKRAEIYQEAYRIINDDVPEISLYVKDFVVAHDTHLKGIATHGLYPHQLRNIGDWYWED